MTGQTRRSLLFGALCAVIGLVVGLLLTFGLGGGLGEGAFSWLFAPAALAGFLCGAALWRLLPERLPGRPRLWSAVAGGLAGLLSHYVTWYLQFLGANLCYWVTGGCTSSLGEPPANPLMALVGAAGLTFFSLMVVGWLTVPVGAVLGLLFGSRARSGSPGE